MSDWQPSAAIKTLRQRAHLTALTRQFFAERNVLEVETPLLCRYGVTDPYMDLISADNPLLGDDRYYLQSSPEYAMKRLLAAGSGPIYQFAKAFRRGEQSRRHNPEFTMLEWYRPGFDYQQLMAEVNDLLVTVCQQKPASTVSYAALFEQSLGLNPHQSHATELEAIARKHIDVQMQSEYRDDWLSLLMSEVIEPNLGFDAPVFVVDYPASQAALAKTTLNAEGDLVAQRFELYGRGLELANGYYELTDSTVLAERMHSEQLLRHQWGRETMASDHYLLAAMTAGLPDCAGVALGFDRLMMLAMGCERISDVISFSIERS